jgi:hypothetical protein
MLLQAVRHAGAAHQMDLAAESGLTKGKIITLGGDENVITARQACR